MSRALNLAGKRFGTLTVERRMENRGGMSVWLCRCDCGTEKAVFGHNLNRVRGTRSCGCRGNGPYPGGWSKEQIQILAVRYPSDDDSVIAKDIGRTAAAVRSAAARHGIVKSTGRKAIVRKRRSDDEDYIWPQNHCRVSVPGWGCRV